MRKITFLFTITFLSLFFLPLNVLAVDFTIDKTRIDAFLQADGSVSVEESHTYTFDGDFNGISRSLIPKKDTAITNFNASEQGKPLEVEQDDELYLVYRNGADETITIDLTYEITGAIDVYEDMAQFYWPFFDSSNESDYENLTITIHPPQSASETIAFGYDTAFDTETIHSNGVVEFDLRFVESGDDGDIRVAYNANLFPRVPSQSGTLHDTLIAEKNKVEESAIIYLERQNGLQQTAPYIILTLSIFLLFLIIFAWRRKQLVKHEVQRLLTSTAVVPDFLLSLPATLYYYKSSLIESSDLLTVGMMDLVRKGNIIEKEDGTYYLANSKTDHPHETKLIHLLFEEIGDNRIFSFEQLEAYTENSETEYTLYDHLPEYLKQIQNEINAQQLFHKSYPLRWTVGIIGFLLIPYMIILGVHDLFMWVFFALLLMFAFFGFAFFYKQRTVEGALIKEQWDQFKNHYDEMDSKEWLDLSLEEKERALIFTTGLNDKRLTAKNKSFTEKLALNQSDIPSTTSLFMLLTLSTFGQRSFENSTQTAAHAATGGFSGGGTGVGGGGGGSGAF